MSDSKNKQKHKKPVNRTDELEESSFKNVETVKSKKKAWIVKPLVASVERAILGGKPLGKELRIYQSNDPRMPFVNGLKRLKLVSVEETEEA
jgi:hypothetical protein